MFLIYFCCFSTDLLVTSRAFISAIDQSQDILIFACTHACIRKPRTTDILYLCRQCLWRMVRNLPGIIDDLDVDCILWDLHQFLVAFPSHTWRHRPSDVPLRTVKTILHSLAKLKGNKVCLVSGRLSFPLHHVDFVQIIMCNFLLGTF